MDSPASPLAPDSAGPSLFKRVLAPFMRGGKGSIWVFVDQGINSLGNFAINMLLARCVSSHRFGLEDLGAFTLIFDVMIFLNGIQSALVIYPLILRGAATNDHKVMSRLASMALAITTLGSPLVMITIIAICKFSRGGSSITLAAIIAAIMATVCWQLQETARRAMIAAMRFREVCVGDAISSLGQAGVVWFISLKTTLSLTEVYWAMAGTSLAALALQAVQIGMQSFSARELKDSSLEGWRVGRWYLSGNAAQLGGSTAYSFNINKWCGPELLGVNGSLNNLFRLTNPIMTAVSTLIMPKAVRAHADGGMKPAFKQLIKFGAIGAIPLAMYLGFVFLFPSFTLDFVYKKTNPFHGYELLVQIIAVNLACIFISNITGTFLNAVGRSRDAFHGQVAYAAGFIVIGMPLTAFFKLKGAAWGGFAGASAQMVVNIWAVMRALRSPNVPGGPDQPVSPSEPSDMVPVGGGGLVETIVSEPEPADSTLAPSASGH